MLQKLGPVALRMFRKRSMLKEVGMAVPEEGEVSPVSEQLVEQSRNALMVSGLKNAEASDDVTLRRSRHLVYADNRWTK